MSEPWWRRVMASWPRQNGKGALMREWEAAMQHPHRVIPMIIEVDLAEGTSIMREDITREEAVLTEAEIRRQMAAREALRAYMEAGQWVLDPRASPLELSTAATGAALNTCGARGRCSLSEAEVVAGRRHAPSCFAQVWEDPEPLRIVRDRRERVARAFDVPERLLGVNVGEAAWEHGPDAASWSAHDELMGRAESVAGEAERLLAS